MTMAWSHATESAELEAPTNQVPILIARRKSVRRVRGGDLVSSLSDMAVEEVEMELLHGLPENLGKRERPKSKAIKVITPVVVSIPVVPFEVHDHSFGISKFLPRRASVELGRFILPRRYECCNLFRWAFFGCQR